MSKYLDAEGYLKATPPVRDLRIMEREVKERMKRGATLAEAVYDMVVTLQTVADNVRYEMVQAKVRARKAKKK